MQPHKTYFNWSTGKDSAMALHALLRNSGYSVEALLTNVNSGYGRVSMHGLRQELLEKQAASFGIPLRRISLPAEVSNEVHNAIFFKRGKGAIDGYAIQFSFALRCNPVLAHGRTGLSPKSDARAAFPEYIASS